MDSTDIQTYIHKLIDTKMHCRVLIFKIIIMIVQTNGCNVVV
jgi:hypothetical protein